MFPILPMLMSLVGNQQKDQNAAISNEAAGYKGQPMNTQGGGMNIMGSFMDMMKGSDKEKPHQQLDKDGLSADTKSQLDIEFGAPGNIDDEDLLSM